MEAEAAADDQAGHDPPPRHGAATRFRPGACRSGGATDQPRRRRRLLAPCHPRRAAPVGPLAGGARGHRDPAPAVALTTVVVAGVAAEALLKQIVDHPGP